MIATNDTFRNYEQLAEFISEYNLSAIDVLDLFTNWHGLQLLTKDFIEDINTDYSLD